MMNSTKTTYGITLQTLSTFQVAVAYGYSYNLAMQKLKELYVNNKAVYTAENAQK
ncbi:hypothetical protein HOR40_gp02 [Pectobacterium phage PP74]|uniref:Uncharacterized protein n=1 Tax=Pectobacterium phage PP74 TaxID=1916101 RepID=A0A1J0MEZ7_9CAUD|nr:hypothetical protein HOR40_gp02 [Pectobacterium phage PP74]APD19662.1 hypothetical protein PP74_02 [Pectobacterium phage PP74]